MRLLYVALKHDYGDPARGHSFEHWNFYHSLVHMGHDVVYVDTGALHATLGREGLERRLVDVARAERPDLAFFVLFKDEIGTAALDRLRDLCPTVNWFCDDHWRLASFSRRYAPHFDRVVTTARSALPRYEAAGIGGVIKSQWACNHYLYRPPPGAAPRWDVTFVGQPHGNRRELLDWLRRQGTEVHAWGHGWPAGRLGQEEMIRVFAESRINLNLVNVAARRPPREAARLLLDTLTGDRRTADGAVDREHAGLRAAVVVVRETLAGQAAREQIKGRNFEIPGCAGFQLSAPAEDLADYFVPGREIAMFRGRRELLDRLRYYLAHEEERRRIAEAGHRRVLAAHTWVHRFTDIFATLGLDAPPLAEALANDRPGDTLEID